MKKSSIILVFIAFFIPVMIAVLLHSRWIDWAPGNGTSHGQLIAPVIALGAFDATDVHGETVDQAALLEHWHLVFVPDGVCDRDCLEQLYWMRQIRTAQGRHQTDIGLMLLSPSTLSAETVSEVLELAPDFRILDGASAQPLLERFPTPDHAGSTYIVDPQGNIMMRYPSDADPTGIRKDLRRLLTWTKG